MHDDSLFMKTLIIYANETLFPDAPNFYEFVARKRGKEREYGALHGRYESSRSTMPGLLKETIDLVLGGMEVTAFKACVSEYVTTYKEKGLGMLASAADHLIIIGSYPAMLYQALQIANVVIAADLSIAESKIQTYKPIAYIDEPFVKHSL